MVKFGQNSFELKIFRGFASFGTYFQYNIPILRFTAQFFFLNQKWGKYLGRKTLNICLEFLKNPAISILRSYSFHIVSEFSSHNQFDFIFGFAFVAVRGTVRMALDLLRFSSTRLIPETKHSART